MGVKKLFFVSSKITGILLVSGCMLLVPLRVTCQEKEHPYLIINQEKVQQLKDRIANHDYVRQQWENMLAQADEAIQDGGPGGDEIELVGLAYQVTKKEKYAKAIKQTLFDYCDDENWAGGFLLNRTPPWHAGLGVADKTYNVAVGFDAIYNYLTEEERNTIAENLVRLGIKPALNDWILEDTRIHTFDSMGHNWWSACVYGAGIGALAVLMEHPEASEWVRKVKNQTKEWFAFSGNVLKNKTKTFDQEGGFYEGLGYGSFAMSEYLKFRLAWSNTFPSREPTHVDQLNKIGSFYIRTSYPDSESTMTPNFGDSGLKSTGENVIKLLIANGYEQDNYWWYLKEVNKKPLPEAWGFDSPFGMLYFNEENLPDEVHEKPDLPRSVLLKDMDWAVMRSSWKQDASMLAVQSGYTWNHTHADAGSFIVFHEGENLIIDSGNSSYSTPEYDGYFRQSEAHNVVLFNGKAQDRRDTYYAVKKRGHLHHLLDNGNIKYVLADNTGPTGQNFYRNYRHFLWIGDVILVIDDLWAHKPGKYEWLLHYGGQANQDGKDIEINRNDASVDVRPLFPAYLPDAGFEHDFPEKMQLEEKMGLKDHDPDTKVPYFAFIPPTKKQRNKFITAIILNRGDSDSPKVERLQEPDMQGVRIHQNGKITDVYLNLLADGRIMHRNSNNTIKGWETDAYLTALTYPQGTNPANPEKIESYFLANGSYLRRDNSAIFSSLSKVNMIAQKKGEELNVDMVGQPVINAELRLSDKPESLHVNGRSKEPVYDEEDQQIKISISRDAEK